jgi:hypothetical protein
VQPQYFIAAELTTLSDDFLSLIKSPKPAGYFSFLFITFIESL